MTQGRKQALSALLLGALLVVAARLAGGRTAPPLYDSFATADAYRFLHPGPGQAGNPTSATTTVPYTGKDTGAQTLATGENPPQAQILIGADSMVIPSGAHSITISITPVDTPKPAPPNGVVAGNTYLYRIASDTGQAVTLRPDHPVSIVLRGPTGTTQGTVQLFDGTAWQPQTTVPVGGPNIFAANTTQLGDAALVAPPQAAPAVPPQAGMPWLIWVIAGAAVAITASVLLWSARHRPAGRR
ncbi:MAG TPA: hypothetical protein VGQ42_00640 [Candidatus Dormibacteraeota bacterium]|nr:hypothetical protein [Candidatus Dormibacteraeota bacterium]